MNAYSVKAKDPAKAYRGRIKAALEYRQMPQQELARRMGITAEALSRKMHFRSLFTDNEMFFIQKFFRWKSVVGDHHEDC